MRRVCLCLLALMLACPGIGAAHSAVGAWLPHWHAQAALMEAQACGDALDTAVCFAAAFDQHDAVLLTDGAADLLRDMQVHYAGTGTAVYLSVVNDVHRDNGRIEHKSEALLRRLLTDDRARARHVDDLLYLVDSCGLDGLEIDYENLGDDPALWQAFAAFIGEVYGILSQEGVGLRVVLSWDAPLHVSLPEGPTYSVMCYNLHGPHNGPGPKADPAFLARVAQTYSSVPGTVRMALSTGGFVWRNGRDAQAVTLLEARAMLRENGAEPLRDESSGAMTASWRQGSDAYEMWYADDLTLHGWMQHTEGFAGVDLFRLGGSGLEAGSTLFSMNDIEEAAP